ncbi:MAG: GntR family transcriptional regulator [Lentisphaeria bacterium]|nr:GntR family transcriptional regulator [Lentisphaeria bacterium]
MKTAKKAKKIYEQLRRGILKRDYAPGEHLPRETELAEMFGVSRDTMRTALSMLEAESLIRRIRGYGTYVSESVKRPRITFLLPCAETVYASSIFLNHFLLGVLDEAQRNNCEVETLVVSPTNDPSDIDWSKLFNLNAESRVVVCGLWFRKIFPFLAASGSRTALIYDTELLPEKTAKIIARWQVLEKRTLENVRLMTEHLFRLNSRRPVLILRSLESESVQREISDLCRGKYPNAKPCVVPLVPPFREQDFAADHPDIMKKIADSEFDGILVNDPDAFHFLRKFLPDAPCGYIDLKRQTDRRADAGVFYSDFNLEEIGRQAVRRLLMEPHGAGSRQEFHAEIHPFTTLAENSEKPIELQQEDMKHEQN